MRRSTTLLIALLSFGVVVTPIALLLFFSEGSTVSSPPGLTVAGPIPRQPKPPLAADIRAFLRVNGRHPTTCTAHGSEMVCLLAHRAGRCEQDADGNGSCTYRGTISRRTITTRLLLWATGTVSGTDTITGSDHR